MRARKCHWVSLVWVALFSILGAASAGAVHPDLVSEDVTNLGFIEEISKFRSGAGHDFSYDPTFPFGSTDTTEPPSSMKHYFAPYATHNGDQETVPVYAPFSGTITRVTNEGSGSGINKRVEILSSGDSKYTLIVFHIDLDEAYPQILNDWPMATGVPASCIAPSGSSICRSGWIEEPAAKAIGAGPCDATLLPTPSWNDRVTMYTAPSTRSVFGATDATSAPPSPSCTPATAVVSDVM